MRNKFCINKKLFYFVVLLIGTAFYFYLSNSINNQKIATNSQAAKTNKAVLRPCGASGQACCTQNKCNNGLMCDTVYGKCVKSSCGGDFEPCCGDIDTANRCDLENETCRFSGYQDQICGPDPNREEYNAEIFCGTADGYDRQCVKSSGMTYPNPVKFISAFSVHKPYGTHVMKIEEGIIPAAPMYQLFIDCDNDSHFEKIKIP